MNCISLSISCAIDLIRLVLLKYILSKSIRLYTSYYLIFESHFDILVTSIFFGSDDEWSSSISYWKQKMTSLFPYKWLVIRTQFCRWT